METAAMGSAAMDNDTRGWVMCGFSGLACILGALVICIDIPIRLLPGKHNFRIQESSAFLACSLSLSFGVMLFSALYSMLPTAAHYLTKDGWDQQLGGFIMMSCFVGGFFGIQIISRVLHQYMPSHVVDCDHTHEALPDEELGGHHAHHDHHDHSHSWSHRGSQLSVQRLSPRPRPHMIQVHSTGSITETTPLISSELTPNGHVHTELLNGDSTPASETITHFYSNDSRPPTHPSRPSMLRVKSRLLSFFKDTKANCDEDGPCYGYSDPCGQECFKHVGTRSARTGVLRSATGLIPTPSAETCDETYDGSLDSSHFRISHCHSHTHSHPDSDEHHTHAHLPVDDISSSSSASCCSHPDPNLTPETQHHHHVPTNAFLSIGLQTVIAIALHKFPEGFITYATNHANPSLGFNVFMALSVHNIAEGFAMALPLYLALGSRLRAVFWAALLGGCSQPLGAAVAVAWFRMARRSHLEIDATAYACLFAVTAGIMVSVALQLFVESLGLGHSRNLSIFCAFLGMTVLGVSNALVTE